MPSDAACSTSATAVIPQSTVSTRSKPPRRDASASGRSARTPPRTATADAMRRRPRAPAGAARRVRSRRCRRRRSRRARRCARRPRSPRRSSLPRRAYRRAGTDRGPGARRRGSAGRRPRPRGRAAPAPTRSPRRSPAPRRAAPRRRASIARDPRFRQPSGCRGYGGRRTESLDFPGKSCSNSRPVLKTLLALIATAGLACAAAPASTPTRTVPAGVSVAGIPVGGLSTEPARARIEGAFARSIRVTYRHKNIWIKPETLGTGLSVEAAVGSALEATPRSEIALPVRYSEAKVAHEVARIAKRVDREAVDAEVVGATGNGPEFSASKSGLAVDQRTIRTALAQ